MADGQPQLQVRIPEEAMARWDLMRAQGHDRGAVLAALAEAWDALGQPSPTDFLADLAALRSTGDAEADLHERDYRLRDRQKKLTEREQEIVRREQAAQAREDRAAAKEAKSALRAVVIDAGEAVLKAGGKPEDVLAVFRAMNAARLAPEAVASHVERLGSIVALNTKQQEIADARRAEVEKLTAERDHLQSEVVGLQKSKANLQAEVRAAVETAAQAAAATFRAAGREAADAMTAAARRAETQATKLGAAADQATAAAQSICQTSEQHGHTVAQFILHEALEPYGPAITRAAEIGTLVAAVDGTIRVDRLAVARMILAPLVADDYENRDRLKYARMYVDLLSQAGPKVHEAEPATAAAG